MEDTTLLSSQLTDIAESARAIGHTAHELRGLKKAVGWTRRREARDRVWLSAKSFADGSRHVATLHGYFGGAAERTAVRDRLEAEIGSLEPSDDIPALLEAIQRCADVLAREFDALAARDDFAIMPGAPAKPGPARTIEVARGHVMRTEYRFALEIYQLLEREKPGPMVSVARQRANTARARLIDAGAPVS